MAILPLPQFEADLEADRKIYEALKPPKTLVVRYGVMKLVGEFPYDGEAKPGCGSKVVVRTPRGTEIGEMLTSTCPNSGCSKSVSRKEMLEYIENSGGREYPFFSEGRVLRIASMEDMQRQEEIEQSRHGLKMAARRVAERLRLPLKIVDAEPLLGGERVLIYYSSEERVDFREMVPELGGELRMRIEMRQVGARDEARITADYERCGQHCCCKNFLKVLKPVSMRSAKVQKATLDPLKISGRCGRLMCCLRYEDATYEELRKKLPRRKQRVGTPEGDGFVVDTQILTQLALVQLDAEGKQVAIAVEDITEPLSKVQPEPPPPREDGPRRGGAKPGVRPAMPASPGGGEARTVRLDLPASEAPLPPRSPRPSRDAGPGKPPPPQPPKRPLPKPPPVGALDESEIDEVDSGEPDGSTPSTAAERGEARRRRRRRRGGRRPDGGAGGASGQSGGGSPPPPQGG